MTLRDTLLALREAGLGSLPGGGAEIFNPGVRTTLCAEKISGDRWLEVMETAHGIGLKSNATMLYGHIERIEDRVDHLLRLRELQDRTGGFQAFIPLAFQPKNSELATGSATTGFDDLRTLAAARLYLDNIPQSRHLKFSPDEASNAVGCAMGHFGVILCKRGRPMDRVAGFYIKCCQQIAIICQAFKPCSRPPTSHTQTAHPPLFVFIPCFELTASL